MARSAVKDEDHSFDLHDGVFFSRGCCFFLNFPCLKPQKSDNWLRISTSNEEQETIEPSWWDKGINTVKKVRELSEIVARPKWKTFIRRFNKAGSGCKVRQGKFQYDPWSYSLNFDEGRGQNGQFESDLVFRDFSSRCLATPVKKVQTTIRRCQNDSHVREKRYYW